MKCVIYARVSTGKQADKDLSIPAQLDIMRKYAEQQSWSVIAEFREEGVSGKTTDRPSLQEMLRAIRQRTLNPDVALVHKIDRVARNLYDYATIKAVLRQQGVRLVSVVEHVEDSSTGELIEHIMASFAEFYSANLSGEVKKGMRQKVLQGGWPHRVPRGYTVIRGVEQSVIEVHPHDGPLVRRCFELYATGNYSMKALGSRLKTEGLLSSTGGPISHAHLRRLLSNPFFAGFVHWHGERQPGRHPRIISQELFDKVQEVIRHRYRNPGPKGTTIPGFLLRGLAICGACRGRMTTERHGRHLYYRCSRQTYRRDLCAARACNAVVAHSGITEICKRLRLDRGLADAIQIAAARIAGQWTHDLNDRRNHRLEEEAAIQREELALSKAFTQGDIAPNTYNSRVAELRLKRTELNSLIQTPVHSAAAVTDQVGRILQVATSFWDLYREANEQRQVILLSQVFSAVVLDHEGVSGYTFRQPFSELAEASWGTGDAVTLATAVVAAAA